MEVVSLSSLPMAVLFWQPWPNSWAVTVVCKATFELAPRVARLHETQEEIEAEDRYWDDDPTRSLLVPCDLVPLKAKADVLLVGSAFTRELMSSIIARLAVGTIDKRIEVVRNRAWSPDGKLLVGRPWYARPLRYEHAGGGPGTVNPAGIAPGARDERGRWRVPHLQPPGFQVTRPDVAVPPVGFGPIAPTWPGRAARLGRHAETFSWGAFRTTPVPEDLDRAYFNVAPEDQQLDILPDDAALVLEGLSPNHARLVTRLPGTHPRAFLRMPDRPPESPPMPADTLWIDTDRGIATVVWRAVVSIAHPSEISRIVLADEAPGEDLTWEDVVQRAKDLGPDGIPQRLDAEQCKHQWGPLDFAFPGAAPDGSHQAERRDPPTPPLIPLEALRAMVFPAARGSEPSSIPPEEVLEDPSSPAADAPPDPTEPDSSTVKTRTLMRDDVFRPALPFAPAPPAGVGAVPPPVEPAKPPSAAYRPPLESLSEDRFIPQVPLLQVPVPPAPVPDVDAARTRPAQESFGERAVRGRVSGDVPPAEIAPPAPVAPELARSPARAGRRRMGAAGATDGSALAFSNAAADPRPDRAARAPELDVPPAEPGGVLELLWHDPGLPARLRRDTRFKKLMSKVKPSPEDGDKADRPRRDVMAVLRGAPGQDALGLREALRCAVEDGVFTPPLVVLGGELEVVFDEVEALQAMLAAVSPFAASDPKLKEETEIVQGLLQTPWIQGAARVAEGLAARLREAFAETRRGLPAGYLAEHTEATLLLRRRYQKRVMFGQEMVRALLRLPGDDGKTPAYLPEDAAKELPLFRRFDVKLVVEGRRRVEEGADATVRVLACAKRG